MRVAILGAGNVGTGIGKRLAARGHAILVSFAQSEESLRRAAAAIGGDARVVSVAEAATEGEVIVLATPWAATQGALAQAGSALAAGKIVWDCTNPLLPDLSGLAVGTTTSGGEQVATWARGARVVKAVPPFAELLHAPSTEINGSKPGVFVCGDDADARRLVAGLVAEIGADPTDAGPLTLARYTEPLGMLQVHLAYARGMGPRIGTRLLREVAAGPERRGDVSETAASDAERNKRFVIEHFDAFVNRKDLDAIERNVTPDFLDHDGPGGKPADRAQDRAMMAGMQQRFPDLRVEVRDAVAEGDKVIVRNVWTGTDAQTGRRMELHGFVLWRMAGGKIAERWATVTSFHELAGETLDW